MFFKLLAFSHEALIKLLQPSIELYTRILFDARQCVGSGTCNILKTPTHFLRFHLYVSVIHTNKQ